MPKSLDDAWAGMERQEKNLGLHPTGAGASGVHGQGGAKDIEEQEEDRYMHMLAKSLEKTLREAHLPLVFAGVEEEYGMFKKFDKSKMLLDEYIRGNPDQMKKEELKEKADPIAKAYIMKRNEILLEEFGNLTGTGRTSTDPEAIRDAAQPGKVDLLLIEDGSEEAANAVRMYVLQHHGRVAIVEAGKLPDGAKMAAILRF